MQEYGGEMALCVFFGLAGLGIMSLDAVQAITKPTTVHRGLTFGGLSFHNGVAYGYAHYQADRIGKRAQV